MFIANYMDTVKSGLDHLYGNPLIAIIFTAFLVVASYTDLRHMKITNKLNGAFFVSRFIVIPWLGFSIWDIVGAIVCFMALFIPAMVKMQKMGGDIKCVTVIGLYSGMSLAPTFLILSCIYFVLYAGVSKRFIPFAPFFLASNISLMILYYFNIL